jgi:tetratricopeptide (TPR) repeat protein
LCAVKCVTKWGTRGGKSAILGIVIRFVIIWIGLLVSSSLAQSLEVSPWLPAPDGRTTLSGIGFEATSTVALSFNDPRPMLPDGKAVPTSIQADAQGGFRLELKVSEARLSLTAKSGVLSASLVRTPPQLEFLADGSSIVAKDASNGKITQRFYLSGQVKTLEPTATGYRATVQPIAGVEEIFLLENGKILERVVFAPSSALLETVNRGWREKVIGDPVAFWREKSNLDNTNPLLKVQLGLALQKSNQTEAAKTAFSQALDVNVPFYVSLRVAQEFEKANLPDLADTALARAKVNYAISGYDPGFAVSKTVLAAWGNPLETAKSLFKSNNPKRAEAWLAYLRDTSPHFPGAGTVFLEYAVWLDGQNRAGEARQVREFITDLDKGSVFRFGDAGLIRLSAFALAGAAVALVAFLLLQFVLLLKYWSQQTKDLMPFGGRFGAIGRAPFTRLRHSLPAYYTFTEKLVLLVLLLTTVVGVGVWQYSDQADKWLKQTFLTQGTAGGTNYFQALNSVPQPTADYLRGLGLHLSNDLDGAITAYRNSGEIAGAANNLGVILASRGDKAGSEREFQRAAGLGSRVANQNLGSSIVGYRAAFHAAYRKGTAMLEVPSAEELVLIRFGTLEQEFRRMIQDPWSYWLALRFGLPFWAHQALGALILMIVVLSVFWLFIPRVASARLAPRSVLYHLGAILIPGSGLADEVWGILLLPPSIAVVALIAIEWYQLPFAESILQGSSILGLTNLPPLLDLKTNWQYLLIALAVIYAVNVLAWILETLALRKKVPSA